MSRFVALFTLLLALPLSAQEKMSREDTAAILFSNRFAFTQDGEPILSIRIMDDQDEIRLSSDKGFLVHPSGPGGPAVEYDTRHRWTARVEDARPARSAWRVVLARIPTRDFQKVRAVGGEWRQDGVATTTLELGTLFSFEGTVFDSRETLLCDARLFDDRNKAREARRELHKARPGDYEITEVLAQRPEGTIVLSEPRSGLTIKARNAIWFEPLDGKLTVRDVEYARGFPWHGRQTRSYGGSFYLAVDKYGKLAIANVLRSEKLLKGLVPAELYPTAPLEALKAQAVSARNELFSKIGHRHLADPFLVCGDQHCQVYKGLDAERSRSSEAVEATRGKVIFDETGKLADIRYSSTCGGHTEDAHEAWPGVTSPNLKGRWDHAGDDGYAPVPHDKVRAYLEHPPRTWCGSSSKSKNTFRWEKRLSAGELDGLVAKKHDVGSVRTIEVLHRGVSGRANRLRLEGTGGSATIEGELVIRRLFGGLKSSLFVVDREDGPDGTPSRWVFRGGGFGHGVGMCQIGAMEMARAGKLFAEILSFYYKAVSIQRIY